MIVLIHEALVRLTFIRFDNLFSPQLDTIPMNPACSMPCVASMCFYQFKYFFFLLSFYNDRISNEITSSVSELSIRIYAIIISNIMSN